LLRSFRNREDDDALKSIDTLREWMRMTMVIMTAINDHVLFLDDDAVGIEHRDERRRFIGLRPNDPAICCIPKLHRKSSRLQWRECLTMRGCVRGGDRSKWTLRGLGHNLRNDTVRRFGLEWAMGMERGVEYRWWCRW